LITLNHSLSIYFFITGLPAFKKGEVQVVDSYKCGHIDPDYVHTYYDHYKIRNDPWTSAISYNTAGSYEDEDSFWVNNGYDCTSHIGKAVYVEIPSSYGDTLYGCGILYSGDQTCPSNDHYY